jgi:SAM-dependent methyltransferase
MRETVARVARGIRRRLARPLHEGPRRAQTLSTRAPADTALAHLFLPGVEFVRDRGILVDREWSPSGVTAQFTDDAAIYHERYFDRLAFTPLIERCLDLAGIDRAHRGRVLDIGSGGGSSVLALRRLLPDAEVIASDISPQLLRILAEHVERDDELRGRVGALCFDLHRAIFRGDAFDLVVGCAILHHLLDPRAALANVAASLRAGGRIVLVEPLESGSLCLMAIFADVLETLTERGEGDGQLAGLMRAMRFDIQSRLGPPKEKPWTRELDDKWVFDRPYLSELARDLRLSVRVHPAEVDDTRVYESAFKGLLSDAGLASIAVPDAVLARVRAYDEGIAPALKRQLFPTGVIVFTR